jgi:hypothetical protein
MAGDNDTRLAVAEATAALPQCITDKMATQQVAEKKAVEACARIRAIALLLEEEQAFAATLEAEAVVAALQLVLTTISSSARQPPHPSGGDAVVVAMLHAQACGVQNIRSLVSTILDPSSTGYIRWDCMETIALS